MVVQGGGKSSAKGRKGNVPPLPPAIEGVKKIGFFKGRGWCKVIQDGAVKDEHDVKMLCGESLVRA